MAPAAAATARPRARATGRRRSGIRWDRVGRLALLGTLLIVLLLYVSPLTNWIRQSRTASEHRSELRGLERDNAQLKSRIRTLRQRDALEREARKLGMVKEGERAFVIENPPRE
jgi:cell division protein FtsB